MKWLRDRNDYMADTMLGTAWTDVWTNGRRIERVCYLIGALLFGSGLFHLAVFAVDGGPWEGPVSWRKPVTFGLSFGITLATVAWTASYLRLSDRARNLLLGAFAAASVIEVTLVTTQAWRRVPSHFNTETSFDTLVTRTLAAGGGVLIVVLVALTVAALKANPGVPASMRLALRVGYLALLVAMAVGALMIAKGMIQVVNGHPQLAYTTAGAYKPAHAVAMHGIGVLPVLAWLLARTGWDELRRVRVVGAAAAGYALLVAVVTVESLAGTASLDAPLPALVLAGIGGATLLAAAGYTLAGVVRARAARVTVPAGGVR
jgi:hypothetical protein